MTIGLREKLFGVSVVLIAIVGLSSGLYLEHLLRGWIVEGIEADVRKHARSTRSLLESTDAPSTARSLDTLADRMGVATGARITIIDVDGTVLGDSALELREVRRVENHADRPEIRDALRQGLGSSRRYSTTLERQMYYVALPYGEPEPKGVVRASLPMAEVGDRVRQLRLSLGAAALLGLVVAVFMSGLVSHWMTRNLGSLVSRARDAVHPEPSVVDDAPDAFDPDDTSVEGLSEQLERAVDQLALQRDRLEAILESMREAVIVVDQERSIELVNSAAADLLRLTEDPTDRPLDRAIDVEGIGDLYDRAREGEEPTAELELELESTRHLIAQAALEPATGAIVIVLHDVTELRRLEQVRRDFVANVSHELRTPVSIIQANAETLKNGALDDPEHGPRFVDSLLRTAERMSELIEELLELSRLEADEHELELEPVELRPLAERVLVDLRPHAEERRIVLDDELEDELEVTGDPKALEQVLRNFVENAIKYTQQEGHVWLRSRRDTDSIVVEVHDNGPGIDEEHRDRVFERFYRVDAGRSRDEGGTGLGLAIAKHLVRNMGGEVGYRPAKVRGSVFWFALPAVDSQ